MSDTYKNVCPDCGKKMRIRNSIGHHPLMRLAYLQCTNVTCGATFRSEQVITHRLSPSSNPNPALDIPIANTAMRYEAMEKTNADQMDIDDLLNEPMDNEANA